MNTQITFTSVQMQVTAPSITLVDLVNQLKNGFSSAAAKILYPALATLAASIIAANNRPETNFGFQAKILAA